MPFVTFYFLFSGVTISGSARDSFLKLLYSELRGEPDSKGSWKELVGVSKQQYLARLQDKLPVVEVEDIGAEQVLQAGLGVTWVPRVK